jgi:hypothetical protein
MCKVKTQDSGLGRLEGRAMKVFLSSTYADLVEHRGLAAEALERLGQQTGRMEVFGARPEEPREACLQEIDGCDLFVGIYAHRYGYVPPGSDISITELEFRHARGTDKAIFCFLLDEDYPWPPRMIEAEPGKTKLENFKAAVGSETVRDTFTTPQDLAYKIATSIGRYVAQVTAPLDPVVTLLRQLIQDRAGGLGADRRKVAEVLSTAVEIANRTLRYIAARRRTGQRDWEEEAALARGWEIAGVQLVGLPEPPVGLAERYFLKAEYWSDPNKWTEQRIESAKIRLDEISKESRQLLLGLRPLNNTSDD